ncbi:MAG: CBS and ACT domain-containing protein [Syntrophobacteraceae bacterium]
MFVDRSMTRDVITILEDATVLEAKSSLEKHHINHLPVVDDARRLIGVVTDRDVRSALPSGMSGSEETPRERERILTLKVGEIMTRNPVTVSPSNTLEDVLLLMERVPVGALPVVDDNRKVVGIISTRDLMRAFITVLGLREPGTLLCLVVENKLGQMKRIVDAISEERIPFGSILVARTWDEGKRAVFPYLLTQNVAHVKRKLQSMGFELLNPMQWALENPEKPDEK